MAHVIKPHCAGATVHMTMLGDSLGAGYGASVKSKAVTALLFAHLRARVHHAMLANYSIPGADTEKIRRVEVPRLNGSKCDVVFLIAGANDVQEFYPQLGRQRRNCRGCIRNGKRIHRPFRTVATRSGTQAGSLCARWFASERRGLSNDGRRYVPGHRPVL